MKKKLLLIFITITIIIPNNIYALNPKLSSNCIKKENNLECNININIKKNNIKGISFNYDFSNEYKYIDFNAGNNWTLNNSNKNGVLIVTKKNLEAGNIYLGTLIIKPLSNNIINGFIINNLDIAYKCGKKLCDYNYNNLIVKNKINLENKKNNININLIVIVIIAIVLLIGIFLILKKIKKNKTKE